MGLYRSILPSENKSRNPSPPDRWATLLSCDGLHRLEKVAFTPSFWRPFPSVPFGPGVGCSGAPRPGSGQPHPFSGQAQDTPKSPEGRAREGLIPGEDGAFPSP